MANIILQHEGATYRTLGYTGRVTSPSLILEGGGQTLFTPLFAVASGAEGRVGNYYYRCCPLAVQDGGTTYRAAYARRYADSFVRTISGTISHSNVPVVVGQPSGTVVFEQDFSVGYNVGVGGGWAETADVTVMFSRPGVPAFISPPTNEGYHVDTNNSIVQIDPNQNHYDILYWGADKCIIRVKIYVKNNETSTGSSLSGTLNCTLYVDTNGLFGTVSYPDETKSVTASGDFGYGHTYGSAPSLWADNGVSVYNNGDNASFHASKTLTGTVSYNSSTTLSQAFNVSFSGDA